MDRQKFVFWLIIIVFGVSVTAYVTKVMVRRSSVVNFAHKIEDFRNSGVPDFSLPTVADRPGRSVSLGDLRADVILINFWATWCEPCQAEFPSLVALSNKFKGDPRLKIVTISIDKNPADAAGFVTTGTQPDRSNFIALSDPDGVVAAKYGTQKIPETYIIGKNHKLLSKVISEQNWVSPDFLGLLKRLMGPR